MLAATTVIFVGDNGTSSGVTVPPFIPGHGKSTLYEGGINVPLIVSGPSVVEPGREVRAVANTVDLFATVLQLAGVDLEASLPPELPIDSISLVPYLLDSYQPPQRQFVLAENFYEGGPYHVAARGERFKLILRSEGEAELYDLLRDPFEENDLFE